MRGDEDEGEDEDEDEDEEGGGVMEVGTVCCTDNTVPRNTLKAGR